MIVTELGNSSSSREFVYEYALYPYGLARKPRRGKSGFVRRLDCSLSQLHRPADGLSLNNLSILIY